MTDDAPSSPLTPMERMTCECVAKGWGYPRIADELQIKPATARVHVHNVAAKLPSEGGVRPYQRVFLWIQAQRWPATRVA
jgi:DNA-binding NarL/FixJ family response regulator